VWHASGGGTLLMDNQELICIFGVHGSGKTTLALDLQRLLRDTSIGAGARVLPDQARLFLPPGAILGRLDDEEEINGRQRSAEDSCRGLVILDGCMLWNYGYFRYWGGSDRNLLEECIERFCRYMTVLYLPPDRRLLQPDGLRPTSWRVAVRI